MQVTAVHNRAQPQVVTVRLNHNETGKKMATDTIMLTRPDNKLVLLINIEDLHNRFEC